MGYTTGGNLSLSLNHLPWFRKDLVPGSLFDKDILLVELADTNALCSFSHSYCVTLWIICYACTFLDLSLCFQKNMNLLDLWLVFSKQVYHSAWLELCEGMAAARSLDEVIEVHEAYLLSIQRQCFVVPDKLVGNRCHFFGCCNLNAWILFNLVIALKKCWVSSNVLFAFSGLWLQAESILSLD